MEYDVFILRRAQRGLTNLLVLRKVTQRLEQKLADAGRVLNVQKKISAAARFMTNP